MRAMAVTRYGEPLELLDLPEPELVPGYALLEVVTCGVCFSDVKTSRGHMPFSDGLVLPHVPGHEVFGRVLKTDPPGLVPEGSGVVVFHYWPCGRCMACRSGDETLCGDPVAWMGFTHPGGFRERISAPVDRLVPVPPTADPIHAAPMSCALGTSYRSVVTRGGVRAGTRVVILGLGGVGIHAAQMARAGGGDVVGFDVHGPTLEAARDLGLDARRADDADAERALLGETGDVGVDVVVDTVGSEETLAMATRLVRAGGRIVAVGYSPTTAFSVPTPRLVLDEIEIVGSRYAHRGEIERAISLVTEGRVRPVIGLVRPLEEVNQVLEALESGDMVGRAVLDVAGISGR